MNTAAPLPSVISDPRPLENGPASSLSQAQTRLAQRLNDLLPQTQCTRCGYRDCLAYAQGLASGQAQLNRCPPGGSEGVARLAEALCQPPLPLDPAHGLASPRQIVFIDENTCIGCTLCIQACPVDAIIGAPKRMHTVLEAWCTGCDLCLPACPVDCIQHENASGKATGWAAWSSAQAQAARQRYAMRSERIALEDQEQARQLAAKAAPQLAPAQLSCATSKPLPAGAPILTGSHQLLDPKRAAVEAALARARARLEPKDPD